MLQVRIPDAGAPRLPQRPLPKRWLTACLPCVGNGVCGGIPCHPCNSLRTVLPPTPDQTARKATKPLSARRLADQAETAGTSALNAAADASMNNRKSYLDSMNAGRRRRPSTSLEQLSSTLDELESRLERMRPAREPRSEAAGLRTRSQR